MHSKLKIWQIFCLFENFLICYPIVLFKALTGRALSPKVGEKKKERKKDKNKELKVNPKLGLNFINHFLSWLTPDL